MRFEWYEEGGKYTGNRTSSVAAELVGMGGNDHSMQMIIIYYFDSDRAETGVYFNC